MVNSILGMSVPFRFFLFLLIINVIIFRRLYKNLRRKVCVVGVVYLDQSVRRFVFQNEASFRENQSDLALKLQIYHPGKWGVVPWN